MKQNTNVKKKKKTSVNAPRPVLLLLFMQTYLVVRMYIATDQDKDDCKMNYNRFIVLFNISNYCRFV